MKPILIVPEGQMSAESIKVLNDNDICTVEAKDPSQIKFVDPIPAISNRTEIEVACIKLSRFLMIESTNDYSVTRKEIASYYLKFLSEGTPLDRNGTHEEQKKRIYDMAFADEVDKIARQDARDEAKRKRDEKAAKKAAEKK